MSRCNPGECNTIASRLCGPPEPSRRRPLGRMVIDEDPKTPAPRYSQSPKPRSIDSHRKNTAEPSETSSDDDDDRGSTTDCSLPDENAEDLNPVHRVNQENLKQCLSSTECSGSDTPAAPHKVKGSKHQSRIYVFFIVVTVLIAIALFHYINSGSDYSLPPVDDRLLIELERSERIRYFKSNITDIRNRFPSQNRHTWGDIESGMIDLINQSQQLSITILFSNETKELSCLANSLGKASSKALHSEDNLVLHPDDLGDDYGRAIHRLIPEIRAKKAVVIHDVLNINPRAIQAFHSICDRVNPLVKGTAYILTIIVSNVSGSNKPEKFIEDTLIERFSNKVPDDKLQPLITRLTDGPIISVKSEMRLSGCLEDSK